MALETEIAGAAAQFGVAGLVAWMWLSERRAAAAREAELHQAHERLVEDRRALDAVLHVVQDNTRALSAVEGGLRELSGAVGRRTVSERIRRAGLAEGGDEPL